MSTLRLILQSVIIYQFVGYKTFNIVLDFIQNYIEGLYLFYRAGDFIEKFLSTIYLRSFGYFKRFSQWIKGFRGRKKAPGTWI